MPDAPPITLPETDANSTPVVSWALLLTSDHIAAERALRSINAFGEQAGAAEVILVLGAATDQMRALVASTEGAIVIDSPANCGTAAAWNLAFARARADKIILMHEDSAAHDGVAVALTETLDANPDLALVGPWLTEGQEAVSPTSGGWILSSQFAGGTLVDPAKPTSPSATDGPYAVDLVSSAFCMWRREHWELIGGFDERRYPASGVDADAVIGLRARGLSVAIVPIDGATHRRGTMNHAPGPLTGRRLAAFLSSEEFALQADKWDAMRDRYISADDYAEHPITAGLANAASLRANPRPLEDPPRSRQPLTNPTGGPRPTDVTSEMTERFEAAERAAIDRYCTWLVAAEAELAEGFVVQVAENKRLSEHAAGLDAALIERAAALDSVTGTRWWRLRQAAASLIRKR